ncbi:hypothetical protein FQB35_13475 [Crassaminicella thermophila]|uniref:Uncharacterized protein n=1 Tax=Crassaminicella thermophila TaxID=2599308 RepID=A0A5C0SJT0_CRATE|nr:alginate lyase family protein [Crassaminicella thermophila]QEK13199.1 hypothetical protein FQB35_13475 [Crassaminicella thermophila]
MIKSLINEYGLLWVINRSLYSAKLKMMRTIPSTEKLFERNVSIKRIDIFDIDAKRIEKFLSNLSDEKKEEVITIADRAIEGKIRAFSSIELDYGNSINWHYNPITKTEVDKNRKWYKILDFDPDRGDIKAIWEASRFTHFFYFARAYLITKDDKYYTAFSEQLRNWIEDNQYSYGPNYKCGQEATLRMINALIVYSVFRSCGIENVEDEANLKKLVEGSYKKVLSNFFYAHKCIKNNHTLSEITGLIIGAWCSKDNIKLDKAYRLLDKEIKNQFLADGGYIQYSFNYHRFALQIMEFVLKISNKTKRSLSDTSKELIKKSALLMYQMQEDNGDVPNYGSNDGALIFPVTSCGYRDFRPVLNTIYFLLDDKRLYEVGEYDEELLWFVEEQFDKSEYANIKKESSGYKESGFYSLRHKDGFLMTVLQNFKTRPAQMDQLHIDLWHKGKNILCDSGTYSYATDIGKEMALTAAHNTVKVDDKEQMKKRGPFLIYDWSKAKDVEFTKERFKGTMISKNGYSHTRSIKKIEGGYLIEDIVNGDGNQCKLSFHTPCEVKMIDRGFELLDDGIVIARIINIGNFDVKRAFRSLYYLKNEEINLVSIYKKMEKQKCHIRFEIQLF